MTQAQIEEFARLIETLETAQTQTVESKSPRGMSTFGTSSACPQRGQDSSFSDGSFDTISQGDQTEAINKSMSDIEKSTYIYNDQNAISAIFFESKKTREDTRTKNRYTPVLPQLALAMETVAQSSEQEALCSVTKDHEPKLGAKNEPWLTIAPAPSETSHPPRLDPTLVTRKCLRDQPNSRSRLPTQGMTYSGDSSSATPSKGVKLSTSMIGEVVPVFDGFESLNSLNSGNNFNGFQIASGIKELDFFDSQFESDFDFDFGFDFSHEMTPNLDDSSVCPSTVEQPHSFSTPDSRPNPLKYHPSLSMGSTLISDMKNSSFVNNIYCQTPSSTPGSFIFQGGTPVTVEGPADTPSGQWQLDIWMGNEQEINDGEDWYWMDVGA